jgi:hypothetical protein
MSEDARSLAIYLLTCPHNTIAGVFRLPDGYVCDDMQWTPERVSKAFAETVDKGFANRCETTKWVWINKHLEWNPPENPNQRKCAAKIAALVPDQCEWKLVFISECADLIGIVNEPLPNPSVTLLKPEAVTGTEIKTLPSPVGDPSLKKPAFRKPDDVSESVWADFLTVRKAKKAPVTESGMAGIRREAAKANISLEDALRISVERNWQGFRADWYVPPKLAGKEGASIFQGAL